MAASAKWTFMVYMAGDNNLSSAGDEDLREMRQVGSTADVNLLVQFDNAGSEGTRRFRVLKGGNDLLESLGKTDSGDPNVLLDYVKWAHANYPADHYALVLWNHGGGWEPSAMDEIAQEVRARAYSDREGTERSASTLRRAFFRPTLQRILSQDSPQERAICSDDGSGHSLDTVELGKVLDKATAVLGQKLDLLGMDACLMSNLEVAYQAQPYVSYVVASEESEPNEGWPYDMVLPKLVADPSLPAADLAGHIVQAYVQSYRDMNYSGDVTQAALDLAQVGTLNTALDHLADVLYGRLPRAGQQIWKAQKRTKRFWHNTLADVGSFGSEMKRVTRDKATKSAADEVVAALQPGVGKLVLAEAHDGPGVAMCTGPTVYMPSPLVGVSKFYGDLEFAKKQQWKRMLDAYVKD
jgi:Clostripain family